MLIAELAGVGRDYPLSIEKLCPVLSFYVVQDWKEGCERCKQILRYGGMGHTMSIHSRNEDVILQFGLEEAGVPDRRQHADDARLDRPDDQPRSFDDPGMRRLGRQHHVRQHLAETPVEHQAAGVRDLAGAGPQPRRNRQRPADAGKCRRRPGLPCRRRQRLPRQAGIAAESLARRIDQFLASRGYTPPAAAAPKGLTAPVETPRRTSGAGQAAR